MFIGFKKFKTSLTSSIEEGSLGNLFRLSLYSAWRKLVMSLDLKVFFIGSKQFIFNYFCWSGKFRPIVCIFPAPLYASNEAIFRLNVMRPKCPHQFFSAALFLKCPSPMKQPLAVILGIWCSLKLFHIHFLYTNFTLN